MGYAQWCAQWWPCCVNVHSLFNLSNSNYVSFSLHICPMQHHKVKLRDTGLENALNVCENISNNC